MTGGTRVAKSIFAYFTLFEFVCAAGITEDLESLPLTIFPGQSHVRPFKETLLFFPLSISEGNY